MSIIVSINGREAIPVRALAWMTDWSFGALQVAEALTGGVGLPRNRREFETFQRLQAHHADSEYKAVRRRKWVDVVAALEELEDQHYPQEQWRREATALMPSGVFVWRDEWEVAYNSSPDGPGSLIAIEDDIDAAEDVDYRTVDSNPALSDELTTLILEGLDHRPGAAAFLAPDTCDRAPVAHQAAIPQSSTPQFSKQARTAGSVIESSVPKAAKETNEERHGRRFDRHEEIGGKVVRTESGEWKVVGKKGTLAALAKEERLAGRPYCDERNISKDIKAEAERRRTARAMGAENLSRNFPA